MLQILFHGVFVFYAMALANFCINTFREQKPELTWLDRFFAIVLPIACIGGIVGYRFVGDNSVALYAYAGLWSLGVVSAAWELRDLNKTAEASPLVQLVIGLTTLALFFGPGLLEGWLWVRTLWVH